MLEFRKYCKIKDNYCLCYFGQNDDYLIQIYLLKKIIEKKYNKIKIFIGCRDEKIKLFENKDFILKFSDLKERRLDFAHIREIKFDGKKHPIISFIDECNLDVELDVELKKEHSDICLITTKGAYPTVSLNQTQISKIKNFAISQGYSPVIDGDVKQAGLVIGVENYDIFYAAYKGIRTKLVPTGIGTELYKKLFKNGEIFDF